MLRAWTLGSGGSLRLVPSPSQAAPTVGEAGKREGEGVGVGCWEQLGNVPHTSTDFLCALEAALEPPSPHPSSWHPLGPLPRAWGWGLGAEL